MYFDQQCYSLFICHLYAPSATKAPPFIRIPAELKPVKKVYNPTAYKRQLRVSKV